MANLAFFTPERVRHKQDELYQLSDPALLEQARLISTPESKTASLTFASFLSGKKNLS